MVFSFSFSLLPIIVSFAPFSTYCHTRSTPNGSAVGNVEVDLGLVSVHVGTWAVSIAVVANVVGCRLCDATVAIFAKLPEEV